MFTSYTCWTGQKLCWISFMYDLDWVQSYKKNILFYKTEPE